jgi:high affinity Mn2+ porin
MFQFTTKFAVGFLVPALLASPVSVRAENAQDEVFASHFQSPCIWQEKPSLSAPYSSQFSLKPEREKAYFFSATKAFGWRPWRGGELYFDPELVQGVPLSALAGLGGMVNGEQQKTSGPNPGGPVRVGSIRLHTQF